MANAKVQPLADWKPSAPKSVSKEGQDIALATTMIGLGARLQVLENETNLSYDRLSRLYREIHGCSPPKGMLPFSVDWFITWRNNIHSSIFYNIFKYLERHTPAHGVSALIKAYSLYLEHDEVHRNEEPILSFTRAWILLRFMQSDMLQMSRCTHCGIEFVTHSHIIASKYLCPVCKPPARIIRMLGKEDSQSRSSISYAGPMAS